MAILGCMYGDEAKAKIVDVLANDSDIVVRFQGGNNAGHTIVLNDKKYILHMVPSGILYPDKSCLLANGVVIDLLALLDEIKELKDKGIITENRLFIDPKAHVVLPLHKKMDIKNEESDKDKIGTTKKGIGPCYSDKIARKGIRLAEIVHDKDLKAKLKALYQYHQVEIKDESLAELEETLIKAAKKLKPFFTQSSYLLNKYFEEDKNILFEGAQGSLLDIDFGTYPYVTSSHTVVGGINTGSGYPTNRIDKVYGIYKSYFTRVGDGPFPTELFDESGEKIRKQGNEFGSTTGRPRRCGWFDAVAAKYTAMVNGIDSIALTCLDVLSGFKNLKICTGYMINDEIIREFPSSSTQLTKVKPDYIDVPGWKEDLTDIKDYSELPENTKNYINTIEQLLDTKIEIISVGPDRNQTIFVEK